jgi:hypothetical protein
MALVKQKTGNRVGNANFVLYKMFKTNAAGTICASSATPAATCIFYDTPATPVGTTGANISVACQVEHQIAAPLPAGQTGVLVDPAHTTTPAWITTANYDLATGLGSVNVTNLVNAWPSITFTASTVSITSPTTATTITHGTPVAFDIAVTPTSATGAVALVAQPSKGTGTGASSFSDAGIGQFSRAHRQPSPAAPQTITTSQLPGGTSYPVFASYNGDGIVAAGHVLAGNSLRHPENSFTVVSLIDGNGNPQTTVPTDPRTFFRSQFRTAATTCAVNSSWPAPVARSPSKTKAPRSATLLAATLPSSTAAASPKISRCSSLLAHIVWSLHILATTVSMAAPPPRPRRNHHQKLRDRHLGQANVIVGRRQPECGTYGDDRYQQQWCGPYRHGHVLIGQHHSGYGAVTGLAASGLNGANPMFASGTATFVTKFTTAGAQKRHRDVLWRHQLQLRWPFGGCDSHGYRRHRGYHDGGDAKRHTINLGISVTLSATVTSSVNNGPGITNTVQFLSARLFLATL